ncbi:MAG: sulfurtransferase TusA family protein [Pseudomonadota bacterium]|nr:sulfurtransferase TusA family protein [Pseudomonadota bacterium]
MIDKKVDARGLSCPLPLLKAKQALNSVDQGAVVEVVSDDPSSERDFNVFSKQSGHELLLVQNLNNVFTFRIKKA